MDMHRTGPTADWQTVPAARHNRWQRLAARTNGVLTPGNFFTWLGFILICIGLVDLIRHEYITALILIALGRICDLADGWVAQKTGTKSPFGEKMDAGFDKLATLLAIGALVFIQAVPSWLAGLIIGLQLFISISGWQSLRTKRPLHPSRIGKIGMAAAWLGFLVALFSVIPKSDSQPLRFLALGILLISVVMALATSIGYARQMFSRR